MISTLHLDFNYYSKIMIIIKSLHNEADRLYERWGDLLSKCRMIDAREIEKAYYIQLHYLIILNRINSGN